MIKTNFAPNFNINIKPKPKKLSKKKIFFLLFGILLLIIFLTQNIKNYILLQTQESITEELTNNIFNQLQNLDFSNLDILLEDMLDFKVFSSTSFKDKVADIISGKYFDDYNSLFEVVISLFLGSFTKILPLVLLLVAVAIISQMLDAFKSEKMSAGIKDIVHFITYSLIVIIIVVQFKEIFNITSGTLGTLKNQMDAIFPVLLTLLTALGSVVSVSIFKPVVAVLTQGVSVIFNGFIYPIFVLSFLFIVVGNLTNTVKLNKFNDLIASIFKWSVGVIFTIFGGLLTIQGISAGKFDKVSIFATKFTIKSYIPIIGGYLSEGLDFILLSSILIKNAVGVVGMLLLVFTVLSPIIKILIFKWGLQLVGAILEPMGDSKIGKFATDCSKILIYPIIIIVAVSFMYLLSLGLIISTANVI